MHRKRAGKEEKGGRNQRLVFDILIKTRLRRKKDHFVGAPSGNLIPIEYRGRGIDLAKSTFVAAFPQEKG